MRGRKSDVVGRRRLCAVGALRSKLQGLLERRTIGGSKSIADQAWCERGEPSPTEPCAGVSIAEVGCKLLAYDLNNSP